MATIRLANVIKEFEDGTRALDDVSLEIKNGELLILVGPSGSGKSTALRIIAGLEDLTEGDVHIDEKRVNDVPGKSRDVAMVFQNYALYPYMTVRDNMAFSLKMRKVQKDEIQVRVAQAAKLLGLEDQLDKRPAQLSGGQRQRVAMGRAIVREPRIFLMDEPLSNLDAKLRVQMRAEITKIQRRLGTTMVYVTHDQTEAMTLGHRVAVLSEGRLQQLATPSELYERPANVFVARFIGSPAMNIFASKPCEDGLETDLGVIPVSGAQRRVLRTCGGKVAVGIRPESFEDEALVERKNGGISVEAEVDVVEPLGSETLAYFTTPGPLGAERPTTGDALPEPIAVRLDRSSQIRTGSRVKLWLDTADLHFFDAASGNRLPDGDFEPAAVGA